MQRTSLHAALTGICLVLGLRASAPGQTIQWTHSYAQAKKAAKERGVLIMADFYTDW